MPPRPLARRRADDRRQMPRHAINRVAQYHSDGALPRVCMVTDISDSGARLFAETDMPDVFTIEITGDHGSVRRDCRVVWRLGGECGVRFVDGGRM